MKKEEYVTTVVYNGHLINVGIDDYGQQYFLEYLKDGKLEEVGCGAYNSEYMQEIEYLFGEPKQCVSYGRNPEDTCEFWGAHGYCAKCPYAVTPERRKKLYGDSLSDFDKQLDLLSLFALDI